MRRTSCRLCAADRLEVALPLKPTPIADAYVKPGAPLSDKLYPLELAVCGGCGHVQLTETVDPKLLFSHYTFTTTSSLGLVEHFRGQVDALKKRAAPKPRSLVVDIGSNDGSLLKIWKEKGFLALGVDPASAIAMQANAAGIETVVGYFTSVLARALVADRGKAAIVTANNVFAHSDALADMADGVRELLADDGVFCFEVSYLADIVDKMLFDTVYHEHLCYHAVAPLRTFFAKHGLHLFDVERIAAKGGSLRGFVQRAGGPRKEAAVVGELCAQEAALGLGKPEALRAFGREVEKALEAVREIVSQDSKTRWSGYGASATVTTLLYQLGLGDRLDCLFDDNPLKHGMESPGLRLPVLPSEKLAEKNPDAVLLLAWQYAQPIAKRQEKWRASGGRLLVPLPKPRWLPA